MNSISSSRSIHWPISECVRALFSLTSPWNIHTVRSLRIWRYSQRSKLRRQWQFCRAVLCSWKPCPYTSTSSLHVNNGLHFSTISEMSDDSISYQHQCDGRCVHTAQYQCEHIWGDETARPSCKHTSPPTTSTQPTFDARGPFWIQLGPWHPSASLRLAKWEKERVSASTATTVYSIHLVSQTGKYILNR